MGIVVSDSYKRNTGPFTFVDEVQGAWRTVATIADLNAIPGEDTQTGQVVFVQDTGELYLATTTLNAQYQPQVSWSLTSFSPAVNLQIAANAGLLLQSNTLSTIYNTNLASSLAVPTAVGGIDAGTTVADLNTKTIVEILNDLLFPTVLASIGTNKSVTLTTTSGGTYEVGTALTRTLTANFNPGSITNGDGTPGPDLVGSATNYRFTGTGISQTDQSGNTLSITWNVVLNDNDWDVIVTHDSGTGTYTDNKGNTGTNLDGNRVAATVSDTNTSPNFTGRYRLFYGTGGTTPTTSAEVRALSSEFDTDNTFTLVTGTTDTKFKIALPPNRTIVSVIDTGNLNADVTSTYVLSTISVDDAGGTPRTYNYYEANYGSPYPTSTNHVVTITGTSS